MHYCCGVELGIQKLVRSPRPNRTKFDIHSAVPSWQCRVGILPSWFMIADPRHGRTVTALKIVPPHHDVEVPLAVAVEFG
jgi:hypothetical protein